MSALDGLRVLEVSEGIAGAYAGKLLRDQGAEVVKLEGASHLRQWSAATPDAPVEGAGALFAFLNGGKASVTPTPGATGPCGGGTSTGPTSWSGSDRRARCPRSSIPP